MYIYKIYFPKTKDFYIGSTKDFKNRKRQHIYNFLNNKAPKKLQQAFQQNDETLPIFEILASTKDMESGPKRPSFKNSNDLLEYWEKHYIDSLQPTLNTITSTTYVPMRDPEIVKKNIEARGDKMKGTNNPASKFSESDLSRAIELLRKGFSVKKVADELGVSSTTISDLKNGKSYGGIDCSRVISLKNRKTGEIEEFLEDDEMFNLKFGREFLDGKILSWRGYLLLSFAEQ